MKERCLAILNLPSTASKEDIKKAYRTLVLAYHPDKNPSIEAQAKFIEITKAYDYLMTQRGNPINNVFRRPFKNTAPPNSEQEKPEKEVPEWFKQYREKVKQSRESDSSVYKKIKSSFIYKLSKVVAVISGVITLITLVNYLILTPRSVEVKVESINKYADNYAKILVSEIESNKQYSLSVTSTNQFALFERINQGKNINIIITPLLNDVISIYFTEDRNRHSIDNQNSMSTFFGVYLLIFIPFLVLTYFDGKNIFYIMAIDGKTIITTLVVIEYLIHASFLELFNFM